MRTNLLVFVMALLGLTVGAQTEQCPCCTQNHQAFDFWVGSWEVTNPDGTPAGRNTIEKVLDSCILKENWKSARGGFIGTSTNFYNNRTGEWEQLWIDNSGAHLKLHGNRVGNQMILSSDAYTNANGAQNINRITWTLNNDGTVRQLWEVMEKDSVVNVAFDGLYRKVE
ncbi:MAG TPA: hypothetical protein VKN36_16910 [Eudoraea sp.]|nr:hypothetical protein [Eudoraea sp.]